MERMKYRTVGDYWFDKEEDAAYIVVAEELGDDMAFMVAAHELVESYLTKKRGVTDEEITAFDEEFEKARVPGDESEPGDSPQAPYHIEHGFATSVERMLCAALGINWQDYETKNIEVLNTYGK